MRSRFVFLLIVVLLLVPVTVVITQNDEAEPTPTLQIAGINASNLPTAEIAVNVLDPLGQPIPGLTVDDFSLAGELAELGQVLRVENVTDDNVAYSVVLVIDTSTSMSGRPLENTKEAAQLLIDQLGPDDPVAIMTFDTQVRVEQDFTINRTMLRETIDGLFPRGQTALYQAAFDAIELATQAPTTRRVVVLLSDGAEFGGHSQVGRDAARVEAGLRGVPIYTIGLGFGIDRTYLQELATGTNAQNFESPTPDELLGIFSELSGLLRSQYLITVNLDVPFDGTEYPFELTVNTPFGTTDTLVQTLRAPIPVPLVRLDLPDAPISQPTTISASVSADDEIISIGHTLQGEEGEGVFEDGVYSFDIDPRQLQPGTYNLVITAVDREEDTGTASASLEIAALPSEVTIVPDLTGLVIDTPQTVTLEIDGQTPATTVNVDVAGTVSFDFDEPPYSFDIDPVLLAPGEQTLSIVVENEGGATAVIDQAITIAALPPDVVIEPDLPTDAIAEPFTFTVVTDGQTPVVSVSATLADQTITADEAPFEFTIDPADFAPGAQTLSITAESASGATQTVEQALTIAALPAEFSVDGLTSGQTISGSFMPGDTLTVTVIIEDSQTPVTRVTVGNVTATVDDEDDSLYTAEIALLPLGTGPREFDISVTNAGGVTATVTIPVTINIVPTATPSPTITATPTQTPTPTIDVPATEAAQATVEAQIEATRVADAATADAIQAATGTAQAETFIRATADAQATAASLATAEAAATGAAMATLDAEATGIAQAALEAQATTDAQATVDAEAEIEAQATLDAEATGIAQAALEAQATTDAQATVDAEAEIEAQATADAQATAAQIAQATVDAQAELDAQATADAQAELDAAATVEAQATADAQAELDAQATVDAQAELDAQATANVQATQDARATAQAQATFDAQATAAVQAAADIEATQDAAATQTAEASDDIQATLDAQIEAAQAAVAAAFEAATQRAIDTETATVEAAEQATLDAQATQDAQATLDALATRDVEQATQAALEAEQATQTAEAAEEATLDAEQATQDAQATLDALATRDVEQATQAALEAEQATQTAEAEQEAEQATETAAAELEAEQATQTAEAEQEAEQATQTAEAELEAEQATQTAEAEQEAEQATQAALEALQATQTAEAEQEAEAEAATATSVAMAAVAVAATEDDIATQTAEAEEEVEPTATATAEPTSTPTVTPTEAVDDDATPTEVVPTRTPVGPLTEIEAPGADDETTNNLVPFAAGGLVILILLGLIYTFLRRNRAAPISE